MGDELLPRTTGGVFWKQMKLRLWGHGLLCLPGERGALQARLRFAACYKPAMFFLNSSKSVPGKWLSPLHVPLFVKIIFLWRQRQLFVRNKLNEEWLHPPVLFLCFFYMFAVKLVVLQVQHGEKTLVNCLAFFCHWKKHSDPKKYLLSVMSYTSWI